MPHTEMYNTSSTHTHTKQKTKTEQNKTNEDTPHTVCSINEVDMQSLQSLGSQIGQCLMNSDV